MTTVTKASIEAKIRNVYYINAGAAVQASDQGYNEAIGRKEAYDNAFEKIWEKEGYLLKQKMFEENQK